MAAYLEKAVREAKVHTSWTNINREYEDALRAFIEGVLTDAEFPADLDAFVMPLVEPGRVNALAQTLIKLTAPGVPDLYQGTELWDLSLVDPDNRRPVDYQLRRRLLAELQRATPEVIWARRQEGLPKLWVIHQALALRRQRPELFGPRGEYQPLKASGVRAEHVVAFARNSGAVTVVPRLGLKLDGNWAETTLELPCGQWRNELTGDDVGGGMVQMSELLSRFPVCLLSRQEDVA
jgi:(1->4)-alpha-D-glucan 1-alpha-D-glucosylmutase